MPHDTLALAHPALALGEHLELEIESLLSDGRGLARHNGQAVFVADALPGQRVSAQVTVLKKRLAEAVLTKVLQNAPTARPAPCKHSALCGGCTWQAMPYPEQLEWKRRFVTDALTRIGKLEAPTVLPPFPSPDEWRYRNKMEFAFGTSSEDASPEIGLYRRASHEIVPVTDCLLQSPLTMRIVACVRAIIKDINEPAWNWESQSGLWRFLIVREPLAGGCFVEIIIGRHSQGKKLGEALIEALQSTCPEISGCVLSERTSPHDVAYGERVLSQQGNGTLEEHLGAVSFLFGESSFFQVNTQAAKRMYDTVLGYAKAGPTSTVWDLYCGVGSIGLYIAAQAPVRELAGVEQSSSSMKFAQGNAKRLAPNTQSTWYAGDTAKVIRTLGAKHAHPQLILVDPPRAGLDAQVTEALCSIAPERIIYVSCDPATLARDINRLQGYTLRENQPVDLFPQTPHIESVSLLIRA